MATQLLNLCQDQEIKELFEWCAKAYHQKKDNGPLSIGFMGKSGAGKSSLINTLCQKNICETGGVGGVTRDIKEINAEISTMPVILIDFPGIAENTSWDNDYIELYKKYLDKLDIIIWLTKVDDRAMEEDEKFFSNHFSSSRILDKLLIVLSQVDKAEPKREWDFNKFTPSEKQLTNINKNCNRLIFSLNINYGNIVPVSVIYENDKIYSYNLDYLFKRILIIINETNIDVNDYLIENDRFDLSCKLTKMSFESIDRAKSLLEDVFADLEDTLDKLG